MKLYGFFPQKRIALIVGISDLLYKRRNTKFGVQDLDVLYMVPSSLYVQIAITLGIIDDGDDECNILNRKLYQFFELNA